MSWKQAFKDIPSYLVQTLRDVRDAPMYMWIINLTYLGILVAGVWGWIYWMVETPTETEREGMFKGMSLFLFIFVFVAYRMAWDWILIKLGYLPPYEDG